MNLKSTIFLAMLSMSFVAFSETKSDDDWIVEIPAEKDTPQKKTQPLANPKKDDAEKWLKDFRSAQSKSADALFINDFDKRRWLTPVLKELSDRAERIFSNASSEYNACISAAGLVNGYWVSSVVPLMLSPNNNTNIKLSGVTKMAWEGGQWYSACRDLIDALK